MIFHLIGGHIGGHIFQFFRPSAGALLKIIQTKSFHIDLFLNSSSDQSVTGEFFVNFDLEIRNSIVFQTEVLKTRQILCHRRKFCLKMAGNCLF